MKPFISSLVMAASVLAWSGCQDNRVPPLENRINELEARVRELQQQQARLSGAKDRNDTDFKFCVAAADNEYLSAIRGNGTRAGSSYNVPVTVMQEIQREKQAKLEECRLLYK